LSKKLSVVFDAPPALSSMNSVTNPPPSAICGNTTGEGAVVSENPVRIEIVALAGFGC
jgi:hypothetical protein